MDRLSAIGRNLQQPLIAPGPHLRILPGVIEMTGMAGAILLAPKVRPERGDRIPEQQYRAEPLQRVQFRAVCLSPLIRCRMRARCASLKNQFSGCA